MPTTLALRSVQVSATRTYANKMLDEKNTGKSLPAIAGGKNNDWDEMAGLFDEVDETTDETEKKGKAKAK